MVSPKAARTRKASRSMAYAVLGGLALGLVWVYLSFQDAQAAGQAGKEPSGRGNPQERLSALVDVVRGTGDRYSTPMTPGTWRSLGTPLSETCQPYADTVNFTSGHKNCVRGMQAWTTGAYDRKGNIYMRGGGHNAYEGNEIYRFSLATGEWTRMNDSGRAVVDPDYDGYGKAYKPIYDNGTPGSAHHYAHLTWAQDRLVMGPMRGFGKSGMSIKDVWTWRPEDVGNGKEGYTLAYEVDFKPYGDSLSDATSNCSEYAPETSDVYINSNPGLWYYDVDQQEVTKVGNFRNSSLGQADCLYDPATKRWYGWKHRDLHTAKLDGARFASRPKKHRGFLPAKISPRSGMELRDGKIFMWNGERSVYVWDPSKLPEPDFLELRNVDSAESPETCGGRPEEGQTNTVCDAGNFGKWWYIESLDVFVGLDEATEPVWVYHPPTTLPEGNSKKADLQGRGYRCSDEVIGWECPNLQKQVNSGSVKKGVYLQAAKVYAPRITNTDATNPNVVDFNGAWIKETTSQGKGAILTRDGTAEQPTVIKNVKITRATNNQNAACVRLEGGHVEVHNLTCRASDMGIQGNVDSILIADSDIGQTLDYGDNLGHVLYICGGTGDDRCSLTIRNTRLHGPGDQGHTLKTGAAKTVLETVELDETRGTGSRLIDAFNGGELVIRESILKAHPNDGNAEVIGYATEGRVNHSVDRIFIYATTEINCAGGDLVRPKPADARIDAQVRDCR